ncbi:hypothetical protein DEU52_117102 [Ensifer adhaerens]|nr:hypothetical protein DEU52_117102 [Ensifer adhaerens]
MDIHRRWCKGKGKGKGKVVGYWEVSRPPVRATAIASACRDPNGH